MEPANTVEVMLDCTRVIKVPNLPAGGAGQHSEGNVGLHQGYQGF